MYMTLYIESRQATSHMKRCATDETSELVRCIISASRAAPMLRGLKI